MFNTVKLLEEYNTAFKLWEEEDENNSNLLNQKKQEVRNEFNALMKVYKTIFGDDLPTSCINEFNRVLDGIELNNWGAYWWWFMYTADEQTRDNLLFGTENKQGEKLKKYKSKAIRPVINALKGLVNDFVGCHPKEKPTHMYKALHKNRIACEKAYKMLFTGIRKSLYKMFKEKGFTNNHFSDLLCPYPFSKQKVNIYVKYKEATFNLVFKNINEDQMRQIKKLIEDEGYLVTRDVVLDVNGSIVDGMIIFTYGIGVHIPLLHELNSQIFALSHKKY